MTADSGKPTGFPACAYPDTHHTVKLSYGVDNPGEVGSTAVYPPSWIRVNSVRKVANTTLQYVWRVILLQVRLAMLQQNLSWYWKTKECNI